MLKNISKLFLGLVVCAGSACVTPTHASSASPLIITHVQAAYPQDAKDEMIAIFNRSDKTVDISYYCLTNKRHIQIACFTPEENEQKQLPPQSHAVIASHAYMARNGLVTQDIGAVMLTTNQSTGELVNSSDTVTLIDPTGLAIDSFNWSSALPAGSVAQLQPSTRNPLRYDSDELSWSQEPLVDEPRNALKTEPYAPEPNLPETPDNPGNESPPVHPVLSEIFPNPTGSDSGNEFIELYNPSLTQTIELRMYSVRIGATAPKQYAFPDDSVLKPGQYLAIYNETVRFTLTNTTGTVQLLFDGDGIDEPVTYANPPEGKSYSYLEGQWMYAAPSPNEPSTLPSGQPDSMSTASSVDTLKPCAANQYRNPETNRCRTVANSADTVLKPCNVGQYRNAETGRCRSIATTTTSPAPCKQGQERNPETNRCRNIVKMSDAPHDVKGVQTQNVGVSWYYWLGIGGIVAVVLSYGVWEWREEIQQLLQKMKAKFARTKP